MKRIFYIAMLVLPLIAEAQLLIINPLKSGNFGDLVKKVASTIRIVAIPFAAVAIIIVGFRFVMAVASSKAEDITKTKKILLWVVVGAAIIVGSSYIAEVIVNFASNL